MRKAEARFAVRTVGILIVLIAASAASRDVDRAAAPPRLPPPEEPIAIDYFRSLLGKGGPSAILDGLYVAPPAILEPLMSGIASGNPEWLDLYETLRQETERLHQRGTLAQLNDAVAQGLGVNAEGILRFVVAHPTVPLAEICARTAPLNGDWAEVLDARETLGIVRRQQKLERVGARELAATRDRCLEGLRPLVRRQLRIYVASYGAADRKRTSGPPLAPAERQELQAALATARKAGPLGARRDGHLPDGPFRVDEIPRGALRPCLDGGDQLANPEGPWAFTDEMSDDGLPRARLLSACRIGREAWDIVCQQGGLSVQTKRLHARRVNGAWVFEERPLAQRPLSATVGVADLWPDCPSLSSN